MDDVDTDELLSSDTDELQAMLNITHDVASRYHIKFGEAKSKIQIGKYLGETLNYNKSPNQYI